MGEGERERRGVFDWKTTREGEGERERRGERGLEFVVVEEQGEGEGEGEREEIGEEGEGTERRGERERN